MAHFIPQESKQELFPQSELAVFEALKNNLSNDWFVFHSFNYLTRNIQNQLWDGEIDFLLYKPDLGFLILEVKGGSISCKNGQWLQNGNPIDPVGQARHNKYSVMNLVKRHYGHDVQLRFAHALCFPSCPKDACIWPPDAQDIIISLGEFKRIEDIATRLINQSPLPNSAYGDTNCSDILNLLSPEFDYQQKLSSSILDNTPFFNLLTRQQEAFIEALQDFPRLQFIGGAGTGKTYLAIQKAIQIANNGGEALYLCYNELLARKVQSLTRNYRYAITVHAFFNFCSEVMHIPQNKIDQHRQNPVLYSQALPDLLQKFLSQVPVTYDAVIVDEAQDFSDQIWRLIPQLVAPMGHFYIFHDPAQNIFCQEPHLPDFSLPAIRLTRNCRNTQKIIEVIKPYSELPIMPMDHSPMGNEVIEKHGTDGRALLEETLDQLIKVDKVNYSDIVVLAGHSLKNTCIGDNPVVGDWTLAEQHQGALPSHTIRFYTYMKFKGCEAGVVILLDVDDQDPRWSSAGLYTAMSRAIHQLIILRKD